MDTDCGTVCALACTRAFKLWRVSLILRLRCLGGCHGRTGPHAARGSAGEEARPPAYAGPQHYEEVKETRESPTTKFEKGPIRKEQ